MRLIFNKPRRVIKVKKIFAFSLWKHWTLVVLFLNAFCSVSSAQTYEWAKKVSTTIAAWGRTITVDQAGNTIVAGSFRGTADFDPGPGTVSITSIGTTEDIFSPNMTRMEITSG